MAALKYWLWLSSAKVSARAKALVLDRYGDAETAFFAPEGDISKIDGISPAEKAQLEKRDCSGVSEIISACAEQNIRIITYSDAAYPKRLRNIFAPPPVIYVKGLMPDIDSNAVVAVIGTRKASPYGIKMSREMACTISGCGGIVLGLSGSALSETALRAAMYAGESCIAVLPCAHEQEKSPVYNDVCVKGALISEYAPGSFTLKSFYRERNRLAAALSVAVLVVEAPENSGTKLFVEEAAEQGKEIYAVPGNADSVNSAGTLAMIKEGARLVTDGRELLEEFSGIFPDKIRLDAKPVYSEEKEENESASPKSAHISVDNKKSVGYIDLRTQMEGLNEDQLKIVSAIGNNAAHIDDIIESTGLSAAKVLSQLTILELKGFVRRESGRRILLNTAKK